jgi:DNA polymerase (family X)
MPKHKFSNEEIALILSDMAVFYAMRGVDFKHRAYELAADDVAIYPELLTELYEAKGTNGLTGIPNVGAKIAAHIAELLKTGKFLEYENFKREFPVDLRALLQIEGLGPRKIRDLYIHLDVRTLEDLQKACRNHKVRNLSGFGVKTETKILEGIEKLKE